MHANMDGGLLRELNEPKAGSCEYSRRRLQPDVKKELASEVTDPSSSCYCIKLCWYRPHSPRVCPESCKTPGVLL